MVSGSDVYLCSKCINISSKILANEPPPADETVKHQVQTRAAYPHGEVVPGGNVYYLARISVYTSKADLAKTASAGQSFA